MKLSQEGLLHRLLSEGEKKRFLHFSVGVSDIQTGLSWLWFRSNDTDVSSLGAAPFMKASFSQ